MPRPTWEYDLSATQKSALNSLSHADDELVEAQRQRIDAVLRCRGVGLSWELIARELGISRQAAWEQFSRFARDDLNAQFPR